MPRLRLSTSQISEPIPTISDRQFVVSKVPVTDEEMALERELFWYREKLLDSLKLTWREVGSLRRGDVSLRRLRLTKSMLDVLRADRVEVDLELVGGRRRRREHAAAVLPSLEAAASGARSYADENEFLAVKAHVRNRSGT
jgi:hypothetical protein